MKRKLVLLFGGLLAQSAAHADLIITGVIDGTLTGGIPKAIEVYATSDIADLSIYALGSPNNGSAGGTPEFQFPVGTATAGQFLYVASETTGFGSFFGFAPDFTSGVASINGDDAIELFRDGSVVDAFGEVGVDGTGQPWEYLDGWAYRSPETSCTIAFSESDWSFSGINALDGETTNAGAANPFPVGTYSTSVDTSSCAGAPAVATNVIINEVDADTDSTDVLEFIELYDGGVGNTALDGLSVILYNGSDDASYNAFDLDDFSTDADGYFVLGNDAVVEAGLLIGASNIVQNGADAVALVVGDAADYPNDTPVSATAVQDAIVYDTNDGDDAGLLGLLNASQPQVNEAGGANGSPFDSNQRCDNGTGGARNTDTYVQALPTPGAENNCAPVVVEPTLISAVQGTPDTQGSNAFGDADVSPLIGQVVTIEAIVVGDFQDGDADEGRNLRGFFVQEELADEDGEPESSEGVFVFEGGDFITDVNVGDLVQVTGSVDQFFGETQIDNVTSITVIDSGRIGDVVPASISLPATATTLSQDGDAQPDLEAFEGMLVTFPQTLQITEQFQLDRFNEIKLVQGARPVQFTQDNAPDVVGFEASQQALGARRITYDDGLNLQNVNIGNLDGFGPVYNEANARRMGDTITNLSGVLDYKWAGNSASGATWRVRSNEDGRNVFTSTAEGDSPNPRPLTAPRVDGNLKVVSFNVLNFFTTLDTFPGNEGVGPNSLDPRGADTNPQNAVDGVGPTDEYDRQLAKLTNALVDLDADVVGLIELENDFIKGGTRPDTSSAQDPRGIAIQTLVDALNSTFAAGTYDWVRPVDDGSDLVEFVGDDAIAVGLIYKTGVVEVADGTVPAILDDAVADSLGIFAPEDFPIFDGVASNRGSLAATFTHLVSGDDFTVTVNHFKSKGSSGLDNPNSDLFNPSSPNFDQGDGAGFWNPRRTNAAIALEAWLAKGPTGSDDEDIMIIGDLNAYAMEDPVQYLLENGFNNVGEPGVYSFVFDGQVGTLDYILISDSLLERFEEAEVWGINADEADALDYNLDFGKDPSYFDSSTTTRNSDHDPVIMGVTLVGVPASIEACKDDAWEELATKDGRGFRNQGECVSYVASGGNGKGNDR